MKTILKRRALPGPQWSSSGFSLIEITVAMGIAAIALISLIGMMPQALRMSRDGADQTAFGTMLEDAHDRLEGQPLTVGTPEISPLFYDQQGRFIESVDDVNNPLVEGRFFRLELRIDEINEIVRPPGLDHLKAVRMNVFWPLDPNGEAVYPDRPGMTISYPITALTGSDWDLIDPDHVPKVEY